MSLARPHVRPFLSVVGPSTRAPRGCIARADNQTKSSWPLLISCWPVTGNDGNPLSPLVAVFRMARKNKACKKTGSIFRVGIFLDFVRIRIATRAEGPHAGGPPTRAEEPNEIELTAALSMNVPGRLWFLGVDDGPRNRNDCARRHRRQLAEGGAHRRRLRRASLAGAGGGWVVGLLGCTPLLRAFGSILQPFGSQHRAVELSICRRL